MARRRFKRFATNLISAIALLILDNNILSSVSGFPSQCTNYRKLAERNRNVNNAPARLPLCDNKISHMHWYRFTNRAGSILTSKQVQTGMCGAQNPGWLLGDHPCTKYDTTDAQVCFVNQSSDCGTQVNISITLCGEYYVYRLPALNCSKEIKRRYCGKDSEVPVPSCNITNAPTSPIYPTKISNGHTTNPDPTTISLSTTKKVDHGLLSKVKTELDELHRKNISNECRKEVSQIIINRLSNLTDLDKMDENEMKQQDLNDTVTILQKIVDLNIPDSNLNILDPANNILDSRNAKSWRNMTDDKLIRDLVVTLENYGFQYGESLKNNTNASTIFQNYSNVQLYVKFIKREDNLSWAERLFKFPDASFNLSPDALPQSSGAVIVVLWYKTINSFLTTSLHDGHSYAKINSKIMTANVRPEPKDKFLQPVRISWNIKELNDSATCVYWKPELNEKWKTNGCTRVKHNSDSDSLICECDHLTAFAVMDISREMVSKTERRALELISTIGCSLSLFGIFLTILAHALLWRRLQQNAKSKVPSQVLMHLCVAIGMTDILSILAGPAHNYETFCTTVSILLYFFVLAVFGWMLCEGVIIYLQLVNVYTGLSLGGKHLKVFYVIGWGIPVVFVAVLVALNDRNDFITKHACWCRGNGVLFWTFVGTIGLILLINLVIFVLALRSALSSSTVNAARTLSSTKDSTGTTKATAGTTLRKAKLGLKGSAILLPLLGLTWVFGLLVFNRDTIVFKYLFAICNSLQGMMIFVFHVLINKKIHEAISREKKTREARHITKIAVNNTCGTLSTSDGNRRKSSIPVTPTLPKKNFNRPESLTVIQNTTTENNNGSSKPTKLYLEPERNQRSCRSRGMKNNYTTKNNNNSLKSNRNKPACQFNAVILEDLELAKPQ